MIVPLRLSVIVNVRRIALEAQASGSEVKSPTRVVARLALDPVPDELELVPTDRYRPSTVPGSYAVEAARIDGDRRVAHGLGGPTGITETSHHCRLPRSVTLTSHETTFDSERVERLIRGEPCDRVAARVADAGHQVVSAHVERLVGLITANRALTYAGHRTTDRDHRSSWFTRTTSSSRWYTPVENRSSPVLPAKSSKKRPPP